MIEVRKPRVLMKQLQAGTTRLQEECRLTPLKLSADLNYESLSKVNITLRDNQILRQHELVEVYNAYGSIGIYRVVNRGHKVRNTRTYTLNHAFDMLNDCHIVGVDTISGTVTQVLQALLACQNEKIGNTNFWQLGTVECSADYSFDNQYDNVYDRMKEIAEANDGYVYTFDFTTFPWTINFVAKSSTIISEMRMNKGLDDIDISDSDNEQCTKLHLSVDSRNDDRVPKAQQTVSYRTVTDNNGVSNWGVIEKAIGIDTKDVGYTEEAIAAWIARFFDEHRNPELTISVTGEEYALYTGEPMDHIVLGGICRTILPEYNTVFHERVVSIKYPDILRTPLVYNAELANKRKSAGNNIAKLNKEAKRSGGRSRSNAKTIQGIFEDFYSEDGYFESHLAMTETVLRTEFISNVSHVYSVLEQTAEGIRTEVGNSESQIYSSIEQTAERIETTIASTVSGIAWSVIRQTVTSIEQEIARKSKVYIQWTDPNNGVNVLHEGDIWIKRNDNRTWGEAKSAHEPWSQPNVAWRRKYGDIQYVWKNGAWVLVKDFAVDKENEVKLEQTATSLALLGHAVDVYNQEYNSKLEVTARTIRAEVSTARSQIYSVIEQTSTQIRSEVANSISDVRSRITQEADRISLVVEGTGANAHIKPAQIVAAINNAGSSIKISANHIELDGNTIAQAINANDVTVRSLTVSNDITVTDDITAGGAIDGSGTCSFGNVYTEGYVECNELDASKITAGSETHNVSWKSATLHSVSVSTERTWLYGDASLNPTGRASGRIILSHSTSTIHYLGY